MTEPTILRRLEEKDLDAAPALLAAEGWTFDVEELDRIRKLGGAVGAYDGEKLVGFLSFVDLGEVTEAARAEREPARANEPPGLRWIGNVVVAESHRSAGLGARLVADAISDAPRAGLYSVERAVKLYERLGFEARGEAWAMRAETATPRRRITSARQMTLDDGAGMLKLDRDASSMDRSMLLVRLIEAYPLFVRVVRERNRVVGFGIVKPSEGVKEIGPLVAPTPLARDALLDSLLAAAPGPYEATVHGNNAGALKALEERGFTRRFRVVPMFKGEPPTWKTNALVTAAGLEKG